MASGPIAWTSGAGSITPIDPRQARKSDTNTSRLYEWRLILLFRRYAQTLLRARRRLRIVEFLPEHADCIWTAGKIGV